ncbi:PD-(D/E)XK nuclease-like domain-containing protein [Acinetobacter bereziniae]|uniref:PD-(D/E)XK nuclease-like domain-containing protein n=1 Tax=Acinetobacter bereziniae TaxID=106648 RepID=UPI001250C3BE|nr:PD-(D/E)XK nuclease-like domain-containing protein [Acinetobacter bereziniae]
MNAPVQTSTAKMTLDMSNADYHSHPAVSSSQLKTILRSPAHFYAKHIAGCEYKQTSAMAIGTAVHSLFLEPHNFENDCAIEPVVNKRTNEGKAKNEEFLLANLNKTIITQQQFESASAMVEAMKKHPMFKMILSGGIREASVFYKDDETDLDCRVRFDWHVAPNVSEFFPNGLIMDIKKTTDARESEFARSCQKYGYALSASMYLQGYKAYYGSDSNPTFLFFVVEEDSPFESIIYYASDEMIFAGEIKRREAMLKLQQAKSNNEWSGYSKQIQQINLPVWAMKEIAG